MKPIKNILLIFTFLIAIMLPVQASEKVATTADNPLAEDYSVVPAGDAIPKVTARSAIVIEATTGKILYSRNMDVRRYPASTTKIMTLLLALEKANMDDLVTTSSNAYGVEGSTIWLEKGEKIRMEDLMYGMMLVSGNDATVAVAEHIAGSVSRFAKMMTEKAHEIGATETNFVNSSGLPDEKHYTTAQDLAKITAYALNNYPEFKKIVSTTEKDIQASPTTGEVRHLRNENLLLYIYKGCNGVKTGYTDAAGRCVVTAAERNGVQLVSVVLDGLYMWDDSILMLDYGFEHIRPYTVIRAGQKLDKVHVMYGEKEKIACKALEKVTVGYDPKEKGEKERYSTEIELNPNVEAPIKKGDRIGKVYVTYNGKRIASTDVLADEDLAQASIFSRIIEWVSSIFQ